MKTTKKTTKKITAEMMKDAFILGKTDAMYDFINSTRKDNPFWTTDPRWFEYNRGYNSFVAPQK